MSEFRSAIEAFRSEALATLPDARIEEDFAEIQRGMELLEVERLRRLAEIDRRRLYERDGHLSAAAWLSRAHRQGWGQARESVRVARALEQMPETSTALEAGDISISAVRVLAGLREADPEAFGRAEAELVEAARIHEVGELQKVAAYWRQAAELEHAADGEEKIRQRRRLHASVSLLGMVRVDGDLDQDNGEPLLTALRAVLDAEARTRGTDDHRSSAQPPCRRPGGDLPGLAGLIGPPAGRRRAAPRDGNRRGRCAPRPRGRTARARPHRAGIPGDRAADRLRRLGPTHRALGTLRALRRRPQDPGDPTRDAPSRDHARPTSPVPRVRPAPDLVRRAHHVVHRADGGPMALPNLLLLCRRHHRMVHERGGFRLGLEDGRPVFRRPDGSVLEDRAPP